MSPRPLRKRVAMLWVAGILSAGPAWAQERSTVFDAEIVERGFDGEARVSRRLATVWLPYDLYVDGEWSHCGVDPFTLLKVGDAWRLASLAYTVEQPPACRPHPDGPPGR